jgi:hypothetical protein
MAKIKTMEITFFMADSVIYLTEFAIHQMANCKTDGLNGGSGVLVCDRPCLLGGVA